EDQRDPEQPYQAAVEINAWGDPRYDADNRGEDHPPDRQPNDHAGDTTSRLSAVSHPPRVKRHVSPRHARNHHRRRMILARRIAAMMDGSRPDPARRSRGAAPP